MPLVEAPADAKPTTSATTTCIRRTRSSSRCSRNVILSGSIRSGLYSRWTDSAAVLSAGGAVAGSARGASVAVAAAGGAAATGAASASGAATGAVLASARRRLARRRAAAAAPRPAPSTPRASSRPRPRPRWCAGSRSRPPELRQHLAHALADLGQLAGTEHDQGQHQDQEDLGSAQGSEHDSRSYHPCPCPCPCVGAWLFLSEDTLFHAGRSGLLQSTRGDCVPPRTPRNASLSAGELRRKGFAGSWLRPLTQAIAAPTLGRVGAEDPPRSRGRAAAVSRHCARPGRHPRRRARRRRPCGQRARTSCRPSTPPTRAARRCS